MPSEHRTGHGRHGGARRAPDLSSNGTAGCENRPGTWRPVFGAPRPPTAVSAGGAGRPGRFRPGDAVGRKRPGGSWSNSKPPDPRGGTGILPRAARRAGRRGGSGGMRSWAGSWTAARPDRALGRPAGSESDPTLSRSSTLASPPPARPGAGREAVRYGAGRVERSGSGTTDRLG